MKPKLKSDFVSENEERILLGALAFSDLTAEMVATPKPVVFALSADTVVRSLIS